MNDGLCSQISGCLISRAVPPRSHDEMFDPCLLTNLYKINRGTVLALVSAGFQSPRISTPPTSLAPIVGSPTKAPTEGFRFPTNVVSPDSPAGQPIHTPFASSRTQTCPDNMAAAGLGASDECKWTFMKYHEEGDFKKSPQCYLELIHTSKMYFKLCWFLPHEMSNSPVIATSDRLTGLTKWKSKVTKN